MKNVTLETRENALDYICGNTLTPHPHFHREIELIYIEKGSARFFADSHFYKLEQGDFFIAFPNQVHYYDTLELGTYHILIFSSDIIYGLKRIFFNQQPKHNDIHPDNEKNIAKLLKLIRNAVGKYAETFRIGVLNQIMADLLDNFELIPRIKTENTTLNDILNFCEQHFSEDISLELAAKKLHLNKYYISHLINKQLGISFSSYINTLRIHSACELLNNTNNKISDIAGDVGFGSIRSFNRSFSDIMNTTPITYRKISKTKVF